MKNWKEVGDFNWIDMNSVERLNVNIGIGFCEIKFCFSSGETFYHIKQLESKEEIEKYVNGFLLI